MGTFDGKTGGRKSRATVPLILYHDSENTYIKISVVTTNLFLEHASTPGSSLGLLWAGIECRL